MLLRIRLISLIPWADACLTVGRKRPDRRDLARELYEVTGVHKLWKTGRPRV